MAIKHTRSLQNTR
jgi:hypothetical protein